MSSDNWRIPQNAEDYFQRVEKRIGRLERRPIPMSADDLMGPGFAAQAVRIMDWSAREATLNGFYYTGTGAINTPDPNLTWTGQVIAKDDGTGMQQVWNTDGPTTLTWMRTYAPTGDGNVTFTNWKKFATATGLVEEDHLDPTFVDGLTTVDLHNQAVAAIEADIAAVEASVAAGDSANNQRITDEVATLNASIATKSKHTLSPNAPGATPNNAGDVWERHDAEGQIIGRWRGAGGTAWTAMPLDATYIPQLDIGTGTFGDLTGTRILADSIGVSKLVVSNFDNLIADPRFTLPLGDVSGWSNGGAPPAELAIVANADQSGTAPALVLQPGSASYFPTAASTKRWNVSNGQVFRVTIAYHTASAEAASRIAFRMRFFATDGTFTDVGINAPATTADAWQTLTGTITVPSSKTYHQAYGFLAFSGGARVGVIKIGSVSVTRAADANLIVDGSVLARHITADMVSGLLLSGRVIQTNTLANRGIKISDSGLIGYNSSGAATTTIDPTTGLISAQGTIQAGSSTGERIVIRPDGAGGIIEAFSGLAGQTSPGRINPVAYGTTDVGIEFYSGVTSARPGSYARVEITNEGPGGTAYVWANDVLIGNPSTGRTDIQSTSTFVSYLEALANIKTFGTFHSAGSGFKRDAWVGGGLTGASVNNNGELVRTSSSRRYKEAIQPMTLVEARQVLAVEPVTFRWRDSEAMGAERHPGFIAEQAHDVGAGMFVTYDPAGRPDGYRYHETVAALVAIINDQEARLAALEGVA